MDDILINEVVVDSELDLYLKQLECGLNDSFDNFDDYNFKLKNFKLISNNYTKIINWSINQGNQHFSITINCIGIDYNLYKDNKNCINNEEKKIKDYLYNLFPTTTWFFIVSEKTKNNMLHFHAIIAIRNFIDYNYIIKNNLLNSLIDFPFFSGICTLEFDIKVGSLNYFKDIKN